MAAALEFGAAPPRSRASPARIWRSPACARFFDGPALRWAGNEVPVADAGDVLRIDRLVALDEADGTAAWWVLDYKLQPRAGPARAYREQLRRYRAAVQALQPGDDGALRVHHRRGALVELE